MAKLSGVGIVALAGGGLLLYSAIMGKKFSSALQNTLSGTGPSGAATANPIIDSPATSVSAASTASTGTSASSAGSAAAPSLTETTWITSVLTAIGAPATQANITSLSNWIAHEGPYGTQGPNNPLNTTEPGYGGSDWYGSVKGYPSSSLGISATVATMLNGSYGDVVNALRSGNGLCGQSFSGLSTWSGGGYSRVC